MNPGAPPVPDAAGDAEPPQIVTFTLGSELFAADVLPVERIIPYEVPAPVPGAPAWVEGVIRHQRRRVAVVNLRPRFELPPQGAPDRARILIFNVDGTRFGVVADGVRDVVALDRSQLSEPTQVFGGLASEYLHGILRHGEELVAYLDAARLLTDDERAYLRQITSRPRPSPGAGPEPGSAGVERR